MIETPRLELREFGPDDFEAVHAYASNPQVTRFTSWGPNTPAETRGFLAAIHAARTREPRENYTFAIVDRSTDRLIGGASLEQTDPAGPQFVFGYVLNRDWWGKGIGTEAVRALVTYGFDALRAQRLYAQVFVGNGPSAKLLRRLGFRLESEHRRSHFVRNTWYDSLTFAQLATEWQGRTAMN
jgi:[ribosomal protein S5]-alanine N-acetyltransferase